jgi:hypothetical protein
VDAYIELITALPRRERYLVVLPPELLTPRELRIALRVQQELLGHLDRRVALLLGELRARRLAS